MRYQLLQSGLKTCRLSNLILTNLLKQIIKAKLTALAFRSCKNDATHMTKIITIRMIATIRLSYSLKKVRLERSQQNICQFNLQRETNTFCGIDFFVLDLRRIDRVTQNRKCYRENQ
jgi:hypothetical protein